eukprot:CAMPEP_0184301300 /NCGR_PEP_ID=MMETSP1049-20130417/11530_1 /TAXON_ID=77928 /ORGANISM="Proteomonas sulcata, Strain CCMP704" /LENGTH=314 /DNA_ID=CAMNT_0026612269 /DNA_START=17 /DNA_END=961 /DNA_ORIENTATION=+
MATMWQRKVPEQLGKRLMGALRGWHHRMKNSIMLDAWAFIAQGGDVVEKAPCERAAQRQLFESKEHERELWHFYEGATQFRSLLDECMQVQRGSKFTQVRTLEKSFDHYTRRNALLRAMRFHKAFVGTLRVHLLRGENLRVKEPLIKVPDLFGGDNKPSTYAMVQFDGSVDPALYGSIVPKQFSDLVKKDVDPSYNKLFSFEVCSRRCNLFVHIMQKQTLSEDELIGSNELDISKLLENQVTELDVPLEREGDRVGSVRVRIVFEFNPQVVEESNGEPGRRGSHQSSDNSGGKSPKDAAKFTKSLQSPSFGSSS